MCLWSWWSVYSVTWSAGQTNQIAAEQEREVLKYVSHLVSLLVERNGVERE